MFVDALMPGAGGRETASPVKGLLNRIRRHGVLLAALPLLAFAEPIAPDALMRAITEEVIAILKKDLAAAQPTDLSRLVETRIAPVFDFQRMTRIALANDWRLASAEQQAALVTQFRTLLVRTYSRALANYRDQEITYPPLRAAAGDTEVLVRSFVRRPGVEPLSIDYEMAEGATGWKVYDVKVGGVSLVITYRESFGEVVRADGIDGLIRLLSNKNRQNETAAPST